MDRGGRSVRAAWVVVLAVLLLVVGAVPARAAFPGRNGLLVVQPVNGRGLLLVGEGGVHPRQICVVKRLCDRAIDPVWSPDGSEIAFDSPRRLGPAVIYPDGSCLACPIPDNGLLETGVGPWDPSGGLGFLPDGRLVTSVDDTFSPRGTVKLKTVRRVEAIKTDGLGLHLFRVPRSWRQLAWSSTGRLAAVRSVRRMSEVFVVDPRAGSGRRLTREDASAPSWSPDGRRLAVVHDGWVELVGSSGGRPRRLTRGRAPAWAPDGKQLAFVGARDRLFVIAARGGRPRPVGHIRAVRVDWQPVTRKPPSPCQAPAGSSLAAASPDAMITIDGAQVGQTLPGNGALSVLGCLTSDGRERLLESFWGNYDAEPGVGPAAVAGDYAALVNQTLDIHYGGFDSTVAVFDLRTGTGVAGRGGESVSCGGDTGEPEGYGCGIDQLVVGTDGVTAAHTFVRNYDSLTSSCQSVEQIVATDSTGTHVIDSITTPTSCEGPAPALLLSQLSLSGHTLTWSHAGIPESAQLN